jgi:DUF4097 and DUF4098 domain-containing protein YvlB
MRSIRVLCTLVAAAAPLLFARAARAELVPASVDGTVDETRPAKSNGTVEVHLFSGEVRVTGWTQNFVHVKGAIDSDCKLEITPAGDRTEISVSCHGPPEGELEIQVPQTGTIEVQTMSAPVSVSNVSGAVRVHSVNGDIEVRGGAPSEVEARSTSGSIVVHANAAWTRAHTVSGEVDVEGAHGRASLHAVSGECRLQGGDFSEVSMQSVSGDIAFDGALPGQASFEGQSHSGEVRVRVPASTNADVELRTYDGDLSIEVGGTKKTGERSLEARLGTGGAKLRAHSFSGDVHVTSK